MKTADGAVAVVTGGSRGLGLALARELADRGARLAICGREVDVLEGARAELESGRADVFSKACDVGVRAEAEGFLGEATEHFGAIDVLVNNAGAITVGPVRSMTLDDFHQAMNTMFWGLVPSAITEGVAARDGRRCPVSVRRALRTPYELLPGDDLR